MVANGDHQALTLHHLYMNKCQSQNAHPFVELFLRVKYRIYNKGPKLMMNNKGVVGQVMGKFFLLRPGYSHRDAVGGLIW